MLIGLFTTLGGSASILSIQIWKSRPVGTEQVAEADDEFVEEVLALVVPLLKRALAETDGSTGDGVVRTRKDELIRELKQAIHEADIDREHLDRIIREYDRRKRPMQLQRERDSMFRKSYKRFAWFAADAFGFAIVLGVYAAAGLTLSVWPPDMWDLVFLPLSVHMAVNLHYGILAFNLANDAQQELREMASDDETSEDAPSDKVATEDAPSGEGTTDLERE